jgi:hypothetical protein
MRRGVIRKNSTDVSEDLIASIFRVEEHAREKINKQAETLVEFLQDYKAL